MQFSLDQADNSSMNLNKEKINDNNYDLIYVDLFLN